MTDRRTSRVTKISAPALADGAPLGPRGVAFLRRVWLAGGVYSLEKNADRDAVDRAVSGGFVRRDSRNPDLVRITHEGLAYLGRHRSAH